MELVNDTPFSPMFFESFDEQDRPINVAILRGTFDILPEGIVKPAAEQPPVVMADEYYDQPLTSSVRVDTDLVPKKYCADITLEAVAHAPEGRPQEAWEVGVSVGNLSKRLRVTGPRYWRYGFSGWTLTRPEPCLEVPIRYECAYGGVYRRDEEEIRYEQNPVGRGFVDLARIDRKVLVPAPQVESPEEPIGEIDRAYRPAGLGPIAKHCLPRRSLCGTPDAKWKAERWPLRPVDFRFEYYNCSSQGLRYDGHLRGDETVVLCGTSRHGDVGFRLPDLRLIVFALARGGNISLEPLLLDTLHINTELDRVSLTWRATFAKQAPLITLQIAAE